MTDASVPPETSMFALQTHPRDAPGPKSSAILLYQFALSFAEPSNRDDTPR